VTEKQERIDKKHRFPLRVDEVEYCETEAYCFSHNCSINEYYNEAIKFAQKNEVFINEFEKEHKRDDRRGHFAYLQDSRTLKKGKVI
jgi:hypothetical protein